MSHIFISYSHDDSEYALRLVEALEQKGFSAWIDERIDYGTKWPHVIQEHIDECSAFVVIMTEHSYESQWVKNELNRALRKGKPIFPLLLSGDNWLEVETIQYADVRDRELPAAEFFRGIARLLEDQTSVSTLGVYGIQMVRVRAGEFLMGASPEQALEFIRYGVDKDWIQFEQPLHTIYRPEYLISKYPITNLQYQFFIKDTGFEAPDYWNNDRYPEGKDEHPVVGVSWEDAIAYCKRLSEKTRMNFRLPTEAEWEKAARGEKGHMWPWGNEFGQNNANTVETKIGGTTPVGQFSPQGESPFGCADMIGNVWEWTSSQWGENWEKPDFEYPYDPNDGRENLDTDHHIMHILRGGSFNNNLGEARCTHRFRNVPYYFIGNNGFRVVVSPKKRKSKNQTVK